MAINFYKSNIRFQWRSMVNNKIFFSFQITGTLLCSSIRLWCVTWINSGGEEMQDDIETCRPAYRRRKLGYGQTTAHEMEAIPSTSTATNFDSATKSNSPKTDSNKTTVAFKKSENPSKTAAIDEPVSRSNYILDLSTSFLFFFLPYEHFLVIFFYLISFHFVSFNLILFYFQQHKHVGSVNGGSVKPFSQTV